MPGKKRAADDVPVKAVKKPKTEAKPTKMPIDDLMTGDMRAKGEGVAAYKGNDLGKGLNIISWNVNGLRAVIKKFDVLGEMAEREKPDVVCLQEIKMGEAETIKIPNVIKGYQTVWNPCTVKKGYSGTAMLIKTEIFNHVTVTTSGLGAGFNDEGRVQILEFDDKDLILINTYVPNSGADLARLKYRTEEWDPALRNFMKREVANGKNVILTGDLNVAHMEVDIHNPSGNHKSAGFTPQERNSFSDLLESGFTDSFRSLHPTSPHFYSYFSYRFGARGKNNGWRLDYFVVNDDFMPSVAASSILSAYEGSDHVPVQLLLKDI